MRAVGRVLAVPEWGCSMTTSSGNWDEYKAAVLERLDFGKVFACVQGQKPSGDGCVTGLCPFHEDSKASFGVSLKTGAWECFAGCGKGDVFSFLMKQSGRPFKEVITELGDGLYVDRPKRATRTGILATYGYHDEEGTLLFEVVRKPGKKFSQRQPDGKGGWIYNLKGTDRVLYRLPALLAADPATVVFIVEGEKDADRLISLGLLATTSPGGAGRWKAAYAGTFSGRDVVILPDNDSPGREYAERVARSLKGKARSVKVLPLPDLPEKGDVSDWLGQGGTKDQLLNLAEAQEPWESFKEENSRPQIQTYGRHLNDILPEVWDIILAHNDPPQLFRSAGGLARIVTIGKSLQLDLLDETKAYGVLIRCADWFTRQRGQDIATKPPKEVAKDLLANPDPRLPYLESIIHTPVFDHDWRMLTRPGYHQDAHLWLSVPEKAGLLEIPTYPTDADFQWARNLILEDLLVDFPFAAQSDLAHAVAALLLSFIRQMIVGPTPLHLIEAPTPGSGKSLLADLISIIVMGWATACTTLTTNEEEVRKKLTAILSRGAPVINIDNLQGGLWSAQVAAAVTADVWEDRLLGKTQMVSFPNRALWLLSANNPKLSMEIARRCVRIRLDPGEEQPWKRTGFKHDPIREWAHQNRHELVRSLLILVRHWIVSGGPRATETLGSFEEWSRIVGGMVGHIGLPGFLGDTDDFYEAADTETGEWKAFILAWHQKHGSTLVSVADLLAVAESGDYVGFAYAANSDQGKKVRFAKSLHRLRGRKFDDLEVVISTDSHTKAGLYGLSQKAKELFPASEGSE